MCSCPSLKWVAGAGSSLSVLNFVHLGSALALRSFARVGSSLSPGELWRGDENLCSLAKTTRKLRKRREISI